MHNRLRYWCLVGMLTMAGLATGCKDTGSGCEPGFTKCGTQCLDVSSDRFNCGGCGNLCLDGQYCAGGQCLSCVNECSSNEERCAPGTTNQIQTCGDPDLDSCLEWGPAQYCPEGEICELGKCTTGCTDECSAGARECHLAGWRMCGDYDRDSCLEWSSVTACQPGESCDAQTAECVITCSNECDPFGLRRCVHGPEGYEVCGNFDADPCQEWGGLVMCLDGEICDETTTQCRTTCTEECTPLNSRRCIPDPQEQGYEICGNYDLDSCLEWGGQVLCPPGETCDSASGQCSSTCQDDCTVGQRVCDLTENGFRVCGYYDADPCLDWSGITPCASFETCNPDNAMCEVNCSDECPAVGDRRCSGDGFDVCGDYDSDPCREWGGHMDCADEQRCEGGQCVEDCVDECSPQGLRVCEDETGYKTCGDFDVDSCTEWSIVEACDVGEVCSNGICAETCTDECNAIGDRECFGNGWRECTKPDPAGCLVWSRPTACSTNEICDPETAQCIPSCTDECTTLGERECYVNGWRECGQYDGDACLDWSAVNPCGSGQVCDPATAQCVDDCTDDCTTAGDKECYSSGWRECGQHDLDSCLEWSAVNPCGATQTCSNGECLDTCVDECSAMGERVCDGNGYRICGQYDEDECLDWTGITYCAYNELCREETGTCEVICQEECLVGQRECVANAWRVCDNHDGDPCMEWSGNTNCLTGQMCYRGYCIANTPPAKVLINEILYDNDGTPDKEYTFIELWGPGGLSLDNFSVVGINGSDGSQYMSIELSGYSLPSNGHFVIAHTETLLDHQWIDLFNNGADLQNGPDSVQVRWGGAVTVDALGYEVHSGTEVFAGEGDPAASADYDSSNNILYCLSRGADHADTGDNDYDFMRRTMYTPGWEGPGRVLWQAYVWGGTTTPALDLQDNVYTIDSWGYITKTNAQGNRILNVALPNGEDGLSSVAISWEEDALYVGATDGLHALDPLTGTAISGWEDPAADGCTVWSSPAVDPLQAPLDGTVYFGTECNSFEAYHPDKTPKWSYPTANWVDSSPARFAFDTGEDLVVFGVGGIGTGQVICLSAEDGTLFWEYPDDGNDLPITGGCNSSPAIGSDGSVYLGCDDGMLWGFDGLSGELKANFPVYIHNSSLANSTMVEGCSPATAPAAEGGDYIFMTSRSDRGNVYVYKDDGTQVVGGHLAEGAGNSSPTLTANSTFLLHVGFYLGAYTALGNLEWYAVLDDSEYAWIASSPTIGFGSIVYVLEYDGFEGGGYLYAIQGSADLFTGQGSFPKFRGDWGNTGWGF